MSPCTSLPRRRLLRLPLPRGLRVRLVVAFGLVAAVAALSTGALTFREARTGILQQGQDTVIRLLRDRVDTLAPDLVFPPGQRDLASFAAEVAQADPSRKWRVLVVYQGLSATSVPKDPFDELTPALRTAATTQTPTVFQRVTSGGRSSLVVGMPVVFTALHGERRATGLTVFVTVPQASELAYVQALVAAVERATVPARWAWPCCSRCWPPGACCAQYGNCATPTRRIAEGRLDTRLAVHGSDELADLYHTFNETAAALEGSIAELRRMEAKARRFAADVSHELRTPLAAMSVVTDILDEDAAGLDPDTAAVRLISQETANLARLVEDLMEISRFDAGAAALHLDEIDLAESVQRTLSSRAWQDSVATWLPHPERSGAGSTPAASM